ncbi:MAG: LysR family transcriptional regulator [Bifidobacterium mongoliense]|jgi:DNA-binding transcriptional LysR family regulator|uniref:LysR family transcriptional regulator n=1 Tax=Bifidobacterium mongoliense TaxID=518643 RepID=UPI002F35A2D0
MFPLLETLVAVYECRQFTLAAYELKVSQSTVSARIAQLERTVGAPLFVRNARSEVTPTEAGRTFYQTARGIDDLWRDSCEGVARASSGREPFVLSFSHTTALRLLPLALRTISDVMNEYDITVNVRNSDVILEEVGAKNVQLGIIEKPIMNESVKQIALCEDRLVVAGNDGGVWLVRERGSGVRYYTDLYFKSTEFSPEHVVEVASNAAIIAALASGFGRSLISAEAVPDGVPTHELGAEFTRRFYAVVPRSGLSGKQQRLTGEMVMALQGRMQRK